jgi:glucose-fructose oxidoreductase
LSGKRSRPIVSAVSPKPLIPFVVAHPFISRRQFLEKLSASAALALAPLYAREKGPVRPLGVALVGLGSYSTKELGPALRLTQSCRLAGVVTGNPAKGVQWARDYGFPERNIYDYGTMARLADNPDIDIVYVVTPNGLHAEHAIAAAKAGKHVIIEKPMANTVAECDAVLAACTAANVRHSVGYRLFFDPYHGELRRLAREEDFGPFVNMSGKRAFVMGAWRWRADRKLAGGGPLMDLGVYLIQGACMAKNGQAPVAVTAEELPKTRPEISRDTEESIRWTMEWADGARAEFLTSYQDRGDTFRAEAARGWIDFRQKAFTYRGVECETSRGALNYGPFVNQQALQMDDFAQCITTGRATPVPGEMGRRDLSIIEAIYRAAASGRRELVTE